MDRDIILGVALPSMIVFGLLYLLRQQGRLRLTCSSQPEVDSQDNSQDIQFSIAHVLVATAAVALAMALETRHRGFQTSIAPFVLRATLVDLATFWAALGLGRPVFRLLMVVPAACLLGLVLPLFTSSGLGKEVSAAELAWASALFGCQALIMAATLLVFRSCGWRLERIEAPEP